MWIWFKDLFSFWSSKSPEEKIKAGLRKNKGQRVFGITDPLKYVNPNSIVAIWHKKA